MISSFDNTQLYLNREAGKGCRVVVVVMYGLCKYQGRYDYFAELFHKAGTGAYRSDHRGHGCSEEEQAYYGDSNELLDDTSVVMDMAIVENPDVPVFLIGRSMDDFTAVLYGIRYSDKKLRGIITSGALAVDNGKLITGVPKSLDVHTQLPNELEAGICSVTEVVDWHGRDPYNTRTFTTGLCYTLYDGIDWFAEKRKEFRYPVLVLHGEENDPVNMQDTYDFSKAAASTDKQMKIYGGLFHEIFNEYCKNEVIGDMIRWVENRTR